MHVFSSHQAPPRRVLITSASSRAKVVAVSTGSHSTLTLGLAPALTQVWFLILLELAFRVLTVCGLFSDLIVIADFEVTLGSTTDGAGSCLCLALATSYNATTNTCDCPINTFFDETVCTSCGSSKSGHLRLRLSVVTDVASLVRYDLAEWIHVVWIFHDFWYQSGTNFFTSSSSIKTTVPQYAGSGIPYRRYGRQLCVHYLPPWLVSSFGLSFDWFSGVSFLTCFDLAISGIHRG